MVAATREAVGVNNVVGTHQAVEPIRAMRSIRARGHGIRALAPLLVLILAACSASAPGAGAPPPSPAPSATQAPTEQPPILGSPTVVTPVAPTTPPAPSSTTMPTRAIVAPTPVEPAGAIPAPAYFIAADVGQVVRIEPDGRTLTQVTFEPITVVEFDVAATGALVFSTGELTANQRTLVAVDGSGRRELLTGAISAPRVAPDGQRVVFRLDDPPPGLIIGQESAPPGVWSAPLTGGRPSLVIADVPVDDVYDAANPAWSYYPVAFSPDGSRLALYAFDRDGPGVPGGELVLLGPGPEQVVRGFSCCEEERWSKDGSALHMGGGGPGPDVRYGLYRIDAATGAESAVIEAAPDGPVPLVRAPRQFDDGAIYAFVELAPAASFSWEYPFRPTLTRVAPDGSMTPLSPPLAAPSEVLWRDNPLGALLTTSDSARPDGIGAGQLAWQAADGSPLRLIAASGLNLRWVPEDGALWDGDCAAFSPLRYEEAAARQFNPATRDLQGRLNNLLLGAGEPDGFYGEQTRAAVTAFQQERALPVSGDVDCATWQALLGRP